VVTVEEDLPEQVIRPPRGWVPLDLRELWRARELLFFFTWRNVLVRYKQTALGLAWAVLQPFLLMLVFSIFLSHVANVPGEGVPYPLFSYTGLLPWTFFATAMVQASNSIVTSFNLVNKVYFPRLTLPMSHVLSSLVDFAAGFVLLIGLMIWYGVYPRVEAIWALPALIFLAWLTALGVGMWLSALNVSYRDVQYVIPFLVQLWLFATPVVYPSTLVSEPWRTLFGLNPMAGVVEGFRWALLGVGNSPGPMVALSAAVAILLAASGAYYFRRKERTFADVI
jgi:homopolymeric O-antigen transport system permease protein